MTASWGGLGVLWRRDVAFIFLRPSRHTFHFANAASLFSLSFFNESHKAALRICGEQSGRDIDKASVTGLTPIVFEITGPTAGLTAGPAARLTAGPIDPIAGVIGFQEATEIIICRKLYIHDMEPHKFLDSDSLENIYPNKDYHRMFIGEIVGFKARK
jgi:hypothetical protein